MMRAAYRSKILYAAFFAIYINGNGVSREKDFGSNCVRYKDNKRNSLLASASCIIEKALLYARLLKYEKDFHLPDSKHMLHGKTGDRDTDPTAETKSEWFAAGFDQFDDIRIQTD